MTKIKICGLRRQCDIDYVNEYCPDYAGFILSKPFRRYISPENAAQLISRLNSSITPVGVFVNERPETVAALLRAEGESRICETIFENRFHHVPQLRKLGADIALCGQTACIRGAQRLHGAAMHAEDLRGAMALVVGALQAEEESTITGIKHLRRGYDNLEENLRALGADVKCVEIC